MFRIYGEVNINFVNFLCLSAIFERLRNILHEGKIDLRVQYMLEVMYAIRKDKFKVCYHNTKRPQSVFPTFEAPSI